MIAANLDILMGANLWYKYQLVQIFSTRLSLQEGKSSYFINIQGGLLMWQCNINQLRVYYIKTQCWSSEGKELRTFSIILLNNNFFLLLKSLKCDELFSSGDGVLQWAPVGSGGRHIPCRLRLGWFNCLQRIQFYGQPWWRQPQIQVSRF